MVLYKDFGKKADDLLNKNWIHEKPLEVTNNWKSKPMTFKNTSTLDVSKGFESHSWLTSQDYVHEGTACSWTVKVNSSGGVTVESKMPNILKGLTLTKTLENKNLTQSTVTLNAEFNDANLYGLHSHLNVVPYGNKLSLTGSSAVAFKGVNVGADVTGPFSLGGFFKYSAGLTFAWRDAIMTAKVLQDSANPGKTTFSESVHMTLPNVSAEVAAQTSFALGDSKPKFILGGKYTFNKSTWFKSALTLDDLRLKFLASYKCSPLTTVSTGVQINPAAKAPADQAKVGFKLEFAQ